MRYAFCFALLALLCAPSVAADPQNINDSGTAFLAGCSDFDAPSGSDAVLCIAWAEGFVNGVDVTESFHKTATADQMFCPPTGSSYIQVLRVIRKYIAANPEREQMPTKDLASEALHSAFPCHK